MRVAPAARARKGEAWASEVITAAEKENRRRGLPSLVAEAKATERPTMTDAEVMEALNNGKVIWERK